MIKRYFNINLVQDTDTDQLSTKQGKCNEISVNLANVETESSFMSITTMTEDLVISTWIFKDFR